MHIARWLITSTALAACCLLAAGQGARAAEAGDPFSAFVAPSEPLSPEEQRRKFHLPPGFEIQLVAAEPEIRKPINLAFDAHGHLWATQSIEYPFGAPADQTPRDEVRVLENLGADGRPERSRTFATGLNIPIGVLPTADGAIVYGIPHIRRLTDDDGDGRADREQTLYGPFGAQDTHGMCNSFRRGLDGWVYACHGFANTSQVRGGDGHEVSMHSGNTYRFRSDGARIEYFTHGQVNPFGLAFDPLGNLYSADCHSLPLYQLLRGAYYPSFGKPDDGLGFGPQTLDHLHGSTGIAGVVYYAAKHFPPEWRDTVFIGNPVTGRVNHDRLEQHGSTYRAVEQPDFLFCDDPWFRPVDLRLGPDGALYIADFYNCIIGHYEVPLTHPRRDRALGRIWRVVYRGDADRPAPPPTMPDLTTSTLAELVAVLGRDNLELRTLATHEIVDRIGAAAAPALQQAVTDANPWRRVHALWALERLGHLGDAALRTLLADDESAVRVHALRVLAERSNWDGGVSDGSDADGGPWRPAIVERLTDADGFVRRAAVEALSRQPHRDTLQPLLHVWRDAPPDDTHLVHAARMAARDHLSAAWGFAAAGKIIAADASAAPRLAELTLGVPQPAAAQFALERLRSGQDAPELWERLLYHAARHGGDDVSLAVQELAMSQRTSPPDRQAAVLRALDRAAEERGQTLPAALGQWGAELAQELLAASHEAEMRRGLELAQALRVREVHAALAELAAGRREPRGLRDAALGACVAIDAAASAGLLREILQAAADPIDLRQHAARDLANVGGSDGRAALAAALAAAPQRLAVEIASALAGSDDGTQLLLDAVAAGKASPTLLQEWVVNLRFGGRNVPELKRRVADLTRGLGPPDQRLRDLIAARREQILNQPGDAALGQPVFTKHCAACHRLGGQGAKIGPELDGIGNRGLERLLEDVLNPSGNVDQAFRASTLALTDGRTFQGLVLREEGSVLILVDGQGKETPVPIAQIEDRQVTPLSPMPANVADLLTEDDFRHLAAYLLEQRQKPAAAENR